MKKAALSAAVLAGMTAAASAAEIRYEAFPDFDSLMKVLMPKYQETHKDVKFATPVMNKHADHHRKLTANLATGSGAGNVEVVDVGFLGAFINSGGLENLSTAPYEADKLEATFPKFAWSQGGGADGRRYAIPVDIGPGVMYYRQDAMEKVGAKIEDVIKSWDSHIEYGRRLKNEKIFLIADAGDVALLIERATAKRMRDVSSTRRASRPSPPTAWSRLSPSPRRSATRVSTAAWSPGPTSGIRDSRTARWRRGCPAPGWSAI